mgnify:FL=1|tara:strand:+ start:394 stop:666 length:273 start_codon:yes stop_codon:yes gene_type:complete
MTKFEIGKKYYREIPTYIAFDLAKQLEKEGKEPYRLFVNYEVIKRTKQFVTLKTGSYPNQEIIRKKIKVYQEIETCELVRSDSICKEVAA